VSATYSFEGQQYIAPPGGDIFPIIPSHGTLDVRADWHNVLEYPVDVAFFMTNALNATYPQAGSPVYEELGFTSLTYNEPRMFGFSLKYRFGPSAGSAEAPPPAAYVPPPAQAPALAPRSYLVFFDFNRSDLTQQAVQIVDEAAKDAVSAKPTRIEVTGHTDTVGSDAYNMRLSRRRAETVAAELEARGVAASEIAIVAKGKRDLLVPTADGVREPQNRRVQIVYSGGPGS
jgi:outer membrane protein OmpA-like peptidoglycan-associated protein